jgi:2-oxoglutarate ferredoxin oxidoreductase subunit delta
MIRLTIHSERCKACGLCVPHCPKHLLELGGEINAAGHHPVVQKEPGDCTGCGICALMCPDICFTIVKTDDPDGEGGKEGAA